jgi:uncharacterized protein (DUF2235 family)
MSSHTEKVDPAFQDHDSDKLKCACEEYKTDDGRRRRRLVVAFDGTQNQFGPQVRTNFAMSSRR